MFQKLGDALRRFMYGRYGADSLNKWLLIFAVVLMLVGGLGSRYLAPWMAAFGTLAYVPLIWSMFRIYSRNIEARRRENAAFQRFFTRLRDRQNRYFTCPQLPAGRPRPARKRAHQYPLPQMRRAVHQENLKKAEETETSRLGFSISYKLEPRPPDM